MQKANDLTYFHAYRITIHDLVSYAIRCIHMYKIYWKVNIVVTCIVISTIAIIILLYVVYHVNIAYQVSNKLVPNDDAFMRLSVCIENI